jgi:RNA polymerase sigma-70 factor (ECF subfamily)
VQAPLPLDAAKSLGGDSSVDLALLARIKQADAAALDALYARYSSPVRSFVWKILRDAEDAEDVVLEVFWQIWRQAGRYDDSRGAPPAWIFAIARSRALDRRRGRHRREDRTISFDDPLTNLDPLDEQAPPDQVASFRQTRDLMREAVETLAPAQREAVELAFFKGLTHAEIAAKLNQPLGTIKTRIRQGLIRLRKKLD